MNVLITGGASCGKSLLAENLCQSLGGNLVYLAAMQPFGEEGRARIQRHRAQRAGKGFRTVECGGGLDLALHDGRTLGATALLEDLGNVVANRLFSNETTCDIAEAETEILQHLEQLAQRCKHLVIVGNEVGCDGTSYETETHEYQLLLGRVARAWAARCDLVTECIAGTPVALHIGGEDKHESVA